MYTSQGGEDCVVMEIKNDGWNDLPCSKALTFICEGTPKQVAFYVIDSEMELYIVLVIFAQYTYLSQIN